MSQAGSTSSSNPEATETFLADSGSAVPVANEITFAGGSNVTTSAAGSVVTINATIQDYEWSEITVTGPTTMQINEGYVANNAALVGLALPAASSFGDTIKICGKGAGLFVISQLAGQTMHISDSSTTTGTGGSITAIDQFSSLALLCTVANTDWTVLEPNGNFTIV